MNHTPINPYWCKAGHWPTSQCSSRGELNFKNQFAKICEGRDWPSSWPDEPLTLGGQLYIRGETTQAPSFPTYTVMRSAYRPLVVINCILFQFVGSWTLIELDYSMSYTCLSFSFSSKHVASKPLIVASDHLSLWKEGPGLKVNISLTIFESTNKKEITL